jgi:hypothetical protein
MIPRAVETLSISRGNIKMGRVPSVSLPHIITCNPVAPCAQLGADGRAPCYVDRIVRLRPNVRAAYARNLRILRASHIEYFGQLAEFIDRARPRWFRFHVSGDWITRDHMRGAFTFARAFPSVRFLAFSKRLSWFPVASTVPRTFALIASLWPGWGKRPRGYRVAYMNDGTETRITARTLECIGNCETCVFCWNLRTLRRDVVFYKH